MKTFRKNGAIGALLDEYEKAIVELFLVLDDVNEKELTTIVDSETEDPDCKSIQTILTHVIHSGNRYILEIRKAEGEDYELPAKFNFNSISDYKNEIEYMFDFAEQCFEDFSNIDIGKPRDFRWKMITNVDLLMEHAIVHILRHRRQIEKFLAELRN